MRYTEQQLDQLQQAILDLSLGQRVARVTHNGRTVEYAASDVENMRKLEREMAGDILAQKGQRRTRTRMTVTSKGL